MEPKQAVKALLGIMTPLGSPVVPDEHGMVKVSSGWIFTFGQSLGLADITFEYGTHPGAGPSKQNIS